MNEHFVFDVFLRHRFKDKPVVRDLANRLRNDGLDEWEIKPEALLAHSMEEGHGVRGAKIEEGLERSRVLVLCMSAHAFGSDWAQLESGTYRFHHPLNKDRRLIPLRLDDAPIQGSVSQFHRAKRPYV